MAREGLRARTITLKLKTSKFEVGAHSPSKMYPLPVLFISQDSLLLRIFPTLCYNLRHTQCSPEGPKLSSTAS